MLLETQQINRAIAEALTGVGLDEKLAWGTELLCECGNPFDKPCRGCSVNHVPHDFTDPRYLIPALEAYCEKMRAGWVLRRWQEPDEDEESKYDGQVFMLPGDIWTKSGSKPFEALRNAFAAALGMGE